MFGLDLTQIIALLGALGGASSLGAWLTYLGVRGKNKIDIQRLATEQFQIVLNEREGDIRTLRERIYMLEQQVNDLRAALQQRQSELINEREENARLRWKNTQLEARVTELEKEVKDLERRLNEVERERDAYRRERDDLQKRFERD